MPFWRKADSHFERLRQAEARLLIPQKQQFPDATEYLEAVRRRLALGEEFGRALNAGQITAEQHAILVRLNRLHAMGLTEENEEFRKRFPG